MRWIDRWRWLAVLLIAGPLAACDIPPEVREEMTCSTLCTCEEGALPGVQLEACVQECVEELDLGDLPEDCFECIQAHSNQCSTLEEDCTAVCQSGPQPEPDPVTPDGGL